MEKKRILLIDDDIIMLKNLEQILDKEYMVSLALSGADGITLMQRGIIPDLILLDVEMPNMNGYETLSALRRIPGCGDIPVIFLTGHDSPEEEVRGLESDAADYVTKPFVKEVLLARVRLHLGRSRKKETVHPLPESVRRLLTETECAILSEIVNGRDNHEIAQTLNYSYGYVKNRVSEILTKLRVKNRRELKQYVSDLRSGAGGEQG